MAKPPGIRDVAKQAHVSAATVSRVINAQAGVDDQTRTLVWQTIKRLGYNVIRHPDALAGILELKIDLPWDLSFVGAGHLLPFEKPFHDTIAQPAFDLGIEAARTLRQATTHPDGRTLQVELPARRYHAGTIGPVP